jgi:hypothetical protein
MDWNALTSWLHPPPPHEAGTQEELRRRCLRLHAEASFLFRRKLNEDPLSCFLPPPPLVLPPNTLMDHLRHRVVEIPLDCQIKIERTR